MREEIFYISSPFNMYCERIIPNRKKFNEPMIFISGIAHTGSCYKTTPDGRPGWAYFFAEKGFEVIVVDWPDIGRSGHVPFELIDGNFMVSAFVKLIDQFESKVILFAHSLSGPYAWKLAEIKGDKIAKIVAIAPGQMGNIQGEPEIIKQLGGYYEIQMPWGILKMDLTKYIKNDDAFINKLIGESTQFPIEKLDGYKASLQTRHPKLTFERLNIDDSQLKIEDFYKIRKTKILIVTGNKDKDHTKEIDGEIADFFTKNKVDCQFLWLSDMGISGNGHMMMLEKNNFEIAELIYQNISK